MTEAAKRLRTTTLLVVLTPICAARAGTLEYARVEAVGDRYQVDLAVRLEAPPARVLAVVRDPERLTEVSDVIAAVNILERPTGNRYLREALIETCVFVFCFKTTMVEWIVDEPDGVILTDIVPERSDFAYGRSRWTVRPTDSGATRVTLESEREPSFWVPPVIGPWMMTRKLKHETLAALARIEELAFEDMATARPSNAAEPEATETLPDTMQGAMEARMKDKAP